MQLLLALGNFSCKKSLNYFCDLVMSFDFTFSLIIISEAESSFLRDISHLFIHCVSLILLKYYGIHWESDISTFSYT